MYSVERAMLNNWAAWLKRNKYQGGPKKPRNSIGAVMELGIPTGPVHYNDEIVDPDEDAELVNQFMAGLYESSHRVYAALLARHVREFVDSRGIRWVNSQLPERKIARAIYDTSTEASVRMFRRDCDAGYEQLHIYNAVA